MNKEKDYLKDISRLEEDKKTLLAEIENWKEQKKVGIEAYNKLNKTNENLTKSITKQEGEREKDQEQINQLKERIKELTDRNQIIILKEAIVSKDKIIETFAFTDRKRKEELWKKDREILKLGEYLKQLNQLVSSRDKEIKNLEEWKQHSKLYEKKITDLENALINLARQKISNNQDWNQLLNQLKTEWDEERELILNNAERARDEQAEEIVALETENMTLHNKLEEAEKELNNQDEIIYKKDGVIEELKEQIKQKELQKSIIGDIDNLLKPQPRNIPIMNERDKQIIQQATAHLEPLVNAETLRERILKARQENTKEAFWELHTDLKSAGLYLNKLLQFYQQDLDQVHSYTYTLGAILRGEKLENN